MSIPLKYLFTEGFPYCPGERLQQFALFYIVDDDISSKDKPQLGKGDILITEVE